MAVVIPDNIASLVGMSEQELRTGFALWMFQSERMALSKAAVLAGLSLEEFKHLAIQQGAFPQYSVQDLHDDLATLRQFP